MDTQGLVRFAHIQTKGAAYSAHKLPFIVSYLKVQYLYDILNQNSSILLTLELELEPSIYP